MVSEELINKNTLTYNGQGRLNLLVIGSSPSDTDYLQGHYGTSSEYKFYSTQFKEAGYDLNRDCFFTTAYNTREKDNTVALERLNSIIDDINPAAIMLLGNAPYNVLMRPIVANGRMNGMSLDDFVSYAIPDRTLGRYICPVWDMQFLMKRNKYPDGTYSKSLWEKDDAVRLCMKKYIKQFVSLTGKPLPEIKPNIRTTLDKYKAIEWCNEALSWDYVSFDYETDTRKPYKDGKIAYCSISNGKIAYSFPYFGSELFRNAWANLMASKKPMIAHNMQFEHNWTRKVCNVEIENWLWDTMLGQHCIFNKKKTNLKFCVYTAFGIAGYDKDADKYIVPSAADTKKYGSYAKNKVFELDPDDAMKYNAQDSLYTAWLYEKQRLELSQFQMKGFNLLMDTSITFANMSYDGVSVNRDAFDSVNKFLKDKTEQLLKEIQEDEDVKKWDGDEPINWNSSKQVRHFLYDILKLKPISKTKTGAAGTDKETMRKLGVPVLYKVIKYKEYGKMATTYISGWEREEANGFIHPDFNLNTVDTFRSSSTAPNLQNSYKRDKEKKKIVRSLIKPRKGRKIVEYDYKSLEVMVNGCHSRDPMLVKYCTDKSTDMHRDGACDVLMYEPDELKGEYRSALKGLYTFAEFYGSYYPQVAQGIWEWVQETPEVLQHLKDKGIKSYKAFEDHVQKCEQKLWSVRFGVHDKWRQHEYDKYKRQGYLDSKTGFRLYAPMSRNNSFNGCVQGDGFHCLCWYINKLRKEFKRLGLKSTMFDEIHDSLVIDLVPEEEEIIDKLIYKYGVIEVAKENPWLIIPLEIEKESSEIDGTWAEMHNCGYLTA